MSEPAKAGLIVALALLAIVGLSADDADVEATPEVVNSFVADVEVTAPSYATPKAALRQNCHPSYSGCLNPNASDYDCAGGSGNGPYYTGPVQVFGYDEYGLDRDGDGWGCE